MRSSRPLLPRRRSSPGALLLAAIVAGCAPADSTDAPPDYSKLVEAKGTVTIGGKPVRGVVVTFLPPAWTASNGETRPDGSYTLQTVGRPGAMPGDYKVAISYLVSADGEPQGLGPRSSMTPPPGMATAAEKLPPEYSDLGRTKLRATVAPGGGPYDFAIDAQVDAPPLSVKDQIR